MAEYVFFFGRTRGRSYYFVRRTDGVRIVPAVFESMHDTIAALESFERLSREFVNAHYDDSRWNATEVIDFCPACNDEGCIACGNR